MNRRDFLANSAAAGAGALLAGTASPVWTSVPTSEAAAGSRAWFEKLVNSPVRIESPAGELIDAQLVGMRDCGSFATHDQFSAVFHLPDDVKLGGLCWIEFPRERRFQLHLDDASRAGSRNECQAQFSLTV